MIYDDFFNDWMNLYPISANLIGINIKSDRFINIYSEKHLREVKQLYRTYLDKLSVITDVEDQYFRYFLEDKLATQNDDLRYLAITPKENIFITLISLINNHSLPKLESFENRFREFGECIPSLISLLRQGMARNIVLPERITKLLIKQLEGLKTNTSYLDNIPVKYQQVLYQYFIPSINQVLVFLKKKYLRSSRKTIGLLDLPKGENLYQYQVDKYTTQTRLSISEIHRIGLDEIDKLLIKIDKLGKVKDEKLLGDKLVTIFENLDKKIGDTTLNKYFTLRILEKCKIKPYPSYLENSGSSALYSLIDKTFYINTKIPISKSELVALSLHENRPGHHYQHEISHNSKIPLYRQWSNWTCFTEGWALYVESLGLYDKLGLYGKYKSELLRAVRLVVDTGIHYYGWSYDKSYQFMKGIIPEITDIEIHDEINSYLILPARALSYKIGELAFLESRKRWTLRHGKHPKSIKIFHDKILDKGPIPISLLPKFDR